ncbi:MAG: hypothetical protein DRP42_02495 [Tenericutes bacterium]|nr:MAG: hypothetical protein DRP42_02495 [Mycoplasmatota bacterium]
MLSSVIAVVFTTALSMTTSVVDSSGNAGSQVSATVIRALALGDITNQDMGKTIKKESKAAFYLGSVAALVSFVRI